MGFQLNAGSPQLEFLRGKPHICMLARSKVVVPWISLRRHIPSGIYQSASALTESDGLGDTNCPSRNSPLSSLKGCDWCTQEKLKLNVKARSSFPLLSAHLTCDRMALKGLPELWLSGFLVSTALLATDTELHCYWSGPVPFPVLGRWDIHLSHTQVVTSQWIHLHRGWCWGGPVTKGRMLCLLDLANYDWWVKLHYHPVVEETTAAPPGCLFSILNYHMIVKVWHSRLCSLRGTREDQGCGPVVLHLSTACKPLVPSPVWLDQKEHTGSFTWNLIMYRKIY